MNLPDFRRFLCKQGALQAQLDYGGANGSSAQLRRGVW